MLVGDALRGDISPKPLGRKDTITIDIITLKLA